MSDISILKDLLDPSMIVCLQEKQEGTHIRYSVILEETQDNYSVSREHLTFAMSINT